MAIPGEETDRNEKQDLDILFSKIKIFKSGALDDVEAGLEHEGTNERATNKNSSRNLFGDLMWPIIFLLKIFGHTSLTYSVTNGLKSENGCANLVKEAADNFKNADDAGNEDSRWYSINYKSLFFVWTALVAFLTSSGWIVFGFENVTGITPVSGNLGFKFFQITLGHQFVGKSYAALVVIKASLFIISSLQLVGLILAWKESHRLAIFLNHCTAFQYEFQTIFPHTKRSEGLVTGMKRKRNCFLFFYVVIPTVAVIPLTMLLGDPNSLIVQSITLVPFAINLSAVSLLEDVKVVMAYWYITLSFQEIRNEILTVVKCEPEKISVSKIHEWQKLVYSVRQQVNLACSWQKNQQLLWIAGSILLITCYVFVELTLPRTGSESEALSKIVAVMLLITAGRLYLKIIAASGISKKENLIAQEMILLNTRVHNYHIRSEIKFLHDMILQCPSVISFGSYVSLNNKLLLGVSSQVVTYIIVMLQFNQ